MKKLLLSLAVLILGFVIGALVVYALGGGQFWWAGGIGGISAAVIGVSILNSEKNPPLH